MDKLLATLKRNRHGQRDWLIGLIIYRHEVGTIPLAPFGTTGRITILLGAPKPDDFA
jgi:hypothetical protein